MTTQSPARLYPLHHHGAWLNAEGTGNTDLSSGHFHRVIEGRVQPDLSDGHTHELTRLPCGWGAPHVPGQHDITGMSLLGDGAPPVPAPMSVQAPPMWPWVVGAVMVVGLVVGGVFLLRSDAE